MEPTTSTALETRVVAEGLAFPEGPIALPDGNVLVVELAGGRLTRISARRTLTTIAELGGGPNSAALGPDGAVYVTNSGGFLFVDVDGFPTSTGMPPEDYEGGSIQRVDLTSGRTDVLYTHCDGERLVGPSDLVFDGHGGFYFTDNGKVFGDRYAMGSLYYALADGSSIQQLAAWQTWPNGIGLSPDGGRSTSATPRVGWLSRWTVTGPGQIHAENGGILAGDLTGKAHGRQSFDGLAIEADGTIAVATLAAPGDTTGGITVFPPVGPPTLLTIDDPSTTNICFGGPDLRTAYITSGANGQLLAADWPRPGLPLHHT